MNQWTYVLGLAVERATTIARELAGTWRWATVTSVDPVKITYDATSAPALISPTILGTPVAVGDRVRTYTIRGKTVAWKIATPTTTYSGSDIFGTLQNGVAVTNNSRVEHDGTRARGMISLTGVTRTNGNQSTPIGVLREELWPPQPFGFSAYYSNGSAQIAVTGTGVMSVRWASSADTIQMYATTTWFTG